MRVVLIYALLTVAGCTSSEPKLYEGKVVDEQGNPVEGVSIILCYVGWGWDWSMAGGFPLVMGKSFCSAPVLTDNSGKYKVAFAGPASTFVVARHKAWTQLESFLADENRVVLIRKDIYDKRIVDHEDRNERAYRERRPDESDTDYYCRVVQKRFDKIELNYRGQRIKIVQSLFAVQGKLVFGVIGSYDAVQALADDVLVSGRVPDGSYALIENFEALAEKARCGDSMYFIQSRGNDLLSALENAGSARIEVRSIRAVFAAQVWSQ